MSASKGLCRQREHHGELTSVGPRMIATLTIPRLSLMIVAFTASARHRQVSRQGSLAKQCSRNAARLVLPKVFEPIRSHFGVSNRVHDIFVAHKGRDGRAAVPVERPQVNVASGAAGRAARPQERPASRDGEVAPIVGENSIGISLRRAPARGKDERPRSP